MKAKVFSAAAIAMLLVAPIASAQQTATQPAPGAGQPATGGKGPGMGYYYRRNMGGPGMGRGAQPGQVQTGKVPRAAPPMPEPPATPASDPSLQTPPARRGGYGRYRGWAPGTAAPYGQPMPRYMRPGRQGYGYPGYRGRGGSAYPGHRQYGNPPGIPSGATSTE